jgi:hypothetical protein
MVREDKSTWKASYFQKLVQLLDEYPKCFIVGADNVGSKQMQAGLAIKNPPNKTQTTNLKTHSRWVFGFYFIF